MPPCLTNFVLLVEMRFHQVGQTGLKLLTSGVLPGLAPQSARITGMSHCAWPKGAVLLVKQERIKSNSEGDIKHAKRHELKQGPEIDEVRWDKSSW